jgi:hypothetical protein
MSPFSRFCKRRAAAKADFCDDLHGQERIHNNFLITTGNPRSMPPVSFTRPVALGCGFVAVFVGEIDVFTVPGAAFGLLPVYRLPVVRDMGFRTRRDPCRGAQARSIAGE